MASCSSPRATFKIETPWAGLAAMGLLLEAAIASRPARRAMALADRVTLLTLRRNCRREGTTTVCEIGSIVDIMHAPSLTNLKLLAPGCRGIRSAIQNGRARLTSTGASVFCY